MNTPACAHCGRPIDLRRRLAAAARPPLRASRLPYLRRDEGPAPLAPPEAPAAAERPLPRFVTMDEAADFLRVSKSTIRNKIRAGELPAKRLKGGQTVLVEVRDVLALLDDYTGRE